MSPIEKIQQGIESSNWDLVIDGFKDLTGKKIKTNTKNLPQHLLDDLETKISDVFNDFKDSMNSVSTSIKSPIKSKKTKQKPKPKEIKTNEINENGDNEALIEETIKGTRYITNVRDEQEKASNELYTKSRTKAVRPSVSSYKVKCNQCGDSFNSRTKGSKDFPQKCKECLKKLMANKRNE